MAFAPAEYPQLAALVLIDEPRGAYYGGQVTGPVMQVLLENVLPYLGIRPIYNEVELTIPGTAPVTVPQLRGMERAEAQRLLRELHLGFDIVGDGNIIIDQFPIPGELVNQGERLLLRAQ
jgi:stage V sporulation protein D (sporulation-specific penicillin-binding protein)